MLESIHNTIRARWSQFLLSIMEVWPTFNSEQLRKLSWAKLIKSYDDVPDTYKFFFEPFRVEGRAFPYAILTPTFEGLLQSRTTEKLVCDLGNEIYVLERCTDTVKIYDYPLEGISCVEVRIVLLDSQIKLHGVTKHGHPESVTVKFNTATEDLFTPILEKIRRAAMDCSESGLSPQTGKLDDLGRLSYKFMNYARRSLLGGEKILQIILQPKIQRQVFTILGKKFYKTISRAHLLLLTDQELILIREEDNPRVIGEYGKIWTYIPLKKIIDLSLDHADGDFLKLSIQPSEGVRIENLYQASAKQEIRQLLSRFAGITADKLQSAEVEPK